MLIRDLHHAAQLITRNNVVRVITQALFFVDEYESAWRAILDPLDAAEPAVKSYVLNLLPPAIDSLLPDLQFIHIKQNLVTLLSDLVSIEEVPQSHLETNVGFHGRYMLG